MENIDLNALNKISYGLYLITTFDGVKHNGMIANTVAQYTSTPLRVCVTINKSNYTHEVIIKTKIMNVNILDESTPFSVFEKFGFKSGRDVDKFAGKSIATSTNGLVYMEGHINAYMSLKVVDSIDMGSHTTFVCDVTESKVVADTPSLTYNYYHANIKPNKDDKKQGGYVCAICGYHYEGEDMPDNYICPLCKHPKSDFVKVGAESTTASDTTKYKCLACGAEFEVKNGDKVVCPVCGVEEPYVEKM